MFFRAFLLSDSTVLAIYLLAISSLLFSAMSRPLPNYRHEARANVLDWPAQHPAMGHGKSRATVVAVKVFKEEGSRHWTLSKVLHAHNS